MVNLISNTSTSIITALCILTVIFALLMLFAKTAINSALGLLAVLLCSAAIYAVIGEHFVATIQILVYAGAIMVLFIFSIMLLNLTEEEKEQEKKQEKKFFTPHLIVLLIGPLAAMFAFILVAFSLEYFSPYVSRYSYKGVYTKEHIMQIGGNTFAMAQELFATHYILFELISIFLLIAMIAAVVLAKRKID
ncbi:MAG: NADH-quinone oxidoreductase subunit J [Oligoflexia bacterium]|nr:NADH-quinone oxidoreductase subunit J [Oligoflexia bacterium]